MFADLVKSRDMLKGIRSRLSYSSKASNDRAPPTMAQEWRGSKQSVRESLSKGSVPDRGSAFIKEKICRPRGYATFSKWDGSLRKSKTQSESKKTEAETNFGSFRRVHYQAHKRIRDTYEPLSCYYCCIE